jgi:hypothetical protein
VHVELNPDDPDTKWSKAPRRSVRHLPNWWSPVPNTHRARLYNANQSGLGVRQTCTELERLRHPHNLEGDYLGDCRQQSADSD